MICRTVKYEVRNTAAASAATATVIFPVFEGKPARVAPSREYASHGNSGKYDHH